MKKRIISIVLAAIFFASAFSAVCFADNGTAEDKEEQGWIAEHPKHQAEVDAWVKNASKNIVLNGIADGKVKKNLLDIVNKSLEEIGMQPGTYGNAMYKYIISHDTKGELLSAALEGDSQTMTEKSASLMAEFLLKKTANFEGAGNIVDLVVDGSKGENWAEQAINLSKAIQKKVFPAIDVAEKFASVCGACRDIYANDSMEDVYNKYKEYSDKNGNISDSDWEVFYGGNRGAWAMYESDGVDEGMLRAKFKERAASESKIANKQNELEKLVKICDRENFLNPNMYNYPRNWTVEDRLRSLYEIRELMRDIFTKDGKLQKGNFTLSTDEEVLTKLMSEWLSAGVRDRAHFYDYVEENGFVPKDTFKNLRSKSSGKDDGNTEKDNDKKDNDKKDDDKKDDDKKDDDKKDDDKEGKYYWYLIDTVITSDSTDAGSFNENYTDVYTASAGSHYHHAEFNYNKDHEEGDFNMTWTAPPAYAEADEQISITISAQASGESDLLFTDFIQVNCTEYKGDETWWNYWSAWYDENDKYRISVSTNPEGANCEKSGEMTVTGSIGRKADEDEKRAIIFSSEGSTTFYIYSCRPYSADLEKQAQAIMDKAD